MAGGLFSRVKTWASLEALTNEDQNAEFDNIIANFLPTKMDDYSVTVVQMQIQTSPGGVGTESQATSLSGEIERLRYVINRMIGSTYWYEAPNNTLNGLDSLFSSFTGLPDNRIESGKIRSTDSQQPSFLIADGAARTVTLSGTPTPFVYRVNGEQYTISSNVTKTTLTAAPSSNNTALVNDSIAADQYDTLLWGEDSSHKTITIDTVGTEISNLVGKWAAFSINNGSATEYFLAFVNSATELSKCFRGYFFDSSSAPVKRIVFSDNDVITLQKLTFVFAKTDGTLDICYTNPTWSFDEPSSPAIGDFWFDFEDDIWKKYDGSNFNDAEATLVGCCIQSTTATVATRSFDFYSVFKRDNTCRIERSSNTVARAAHQEMTVSVGGNLISFGKYLPTWDMSADLAATAEMVSATEQASRAYYLYVTKQGDRRISDTMPYYRAEFYGWYHPHNIWRCVGVAYNDASSNLSVAQEVDSQVIPRGRLSAQTGNGVGAVSTKIRRFLTVHSNTCGKLVYTDSADLGVELFCVWPCVVHLGYSESSDPVTVWGFSKNSTQLTTGISTITITDVIRYMDQTDTGNIGAITDTVPLKVGDVVRPHFTQTPTDGPDEVRLTVAEVA